MMALYIFVILFGLMTGSFLNVCIYRLPKEEAFALSPSHCMACGQRLAPLDLIPVLSYIYLKGKCRYCGGNVSLRHAFVEVLTSVIFLALFLKYGVSVEFLAMVYLMSILTAVFFIDLDHLIIPDQIVIAGIGGGALLFLWNLFFEVNILGMENWYDPLIGAISGSGIMFGVFLLSFLIYKSDGAMGMGDVKIYIPIGLFLGWKLTVISLIFSVLSGGIAGIFLIATGFKKRQDEIPFGPFIVIGTFIAIIWGGNILNWYLKPFVF